MRFVPGPETERPCTSRALGWWAHQGSNLGPADSRDSPRLRTISGVTGRTTGLIRPKLREGRYIHHSADQSQQSTVTGLTPPPVNARSTTPSRRLPSLATCRSSDGVAFRRTHRRTAGSHLGCSRTRGSSALSRSLREFARSPRARSDQDHSRAAPSAVASARAAWRRWTASLPVRGPARRGAAPPRLASGSAFPQNIPKRVNTANSPSKVTVMTETVRTTSPIGIEAIGCCLAPPSPRRSSMWRLRPRLAGPYPRSTKPVTKGV